MESERMPMQRALPPSLLLLLLVVLLQGHAVKVHAHDHHHHHHHPRRQLQQQQQQPFPDFVVSDAFRNDWNARCATREPEERQASEAAFDAWLSSQSKQNSTLVGRQLTVAVDVVWHNIRRSDGTGGLTDPQIVDSMTVLNQAYQGTGFVFALTDTTRTNNDVYYAAPPFSSLERTMKRGLRQGDCTTLNVYNTGQMTALGWAYFPSQCEFDSVLDGVVIDYQTVPGGIKEPYDLGITLVHEVGHWMGLYHTFQDRCTSPGDYVIDTPAEFEPDFVCEMGRDTCGDGGPQDDVINFMNYGPDDCLARFTDGQIARMHSQYSAFRVPVSPPTSSPNAPTTAPASAPTAAPSSSPTICFSKEATVHVLHKGPTKMERLQLGDHVLTYASPAAVVTDSRRGGLSYYEYQPIYAFAHYDTTTYAAFIQIHTRGQQPKQQPLEISGEHLVFVVGKSHPVRADSIRRGDFIRSIHHGTTDKNHHPSYTNSSGAASSIVGHALVTKMETVYRNGLYAPLTTSGTIVVDGIAASCYVSLQKDATDFIELQSGIATGISQHLITHMMLSPVRMICIGLSRELCKSHDVTGLANFVKLGFAFAEFSQRQGAAAQAIMLICCLLFVGPMYALEYALGPKLALFVMVSSVFTIMARGRYFRLLTPNKRRI